MVFWAVWCDRRSMLVVLQSGFRLNQCSYKVPAWFRCLKTRSVLLHEKKFCTRTNAWHGAKSVQSFWAKECPRFSRMMISRQTAPISIRWTPAYETLSKTHWINNVIRNFAHLEKLLTKEWNGLPQKLIEDGIDSWPFQVRRVESLGGEYIE